MNPVYAALFLTMSVSDGVMVYELYTNYSNHPAFRALFVLLVFISALTFSLFIKEVKK